MNRSRIWILATLLTGAASLAVPTAQVAPQAPGPRAGQESAGPSGQAAVGQPKQTRVYSDRLIDVDYHDTDLREVLRVITKFGGLNLAIDSSVPANAKVNLTLDRVPWDQALETVLKLGSLGYEIDGNIVRVMSADAMQKETDNRLKLAETRADAEARGSVTPRVFALNYAKGEDLEKILKVSVLSKYGSTNFDPRTNTLVVNDVPGRLDQVAELITRLDQPELQVQIEARIVQTSRDQAKALGVQWGFNGRVTPDQGNTTNLAFPNSGTAGGRVGFQGPNDPRANSLQTTGTAVNLPVVGATSGVGLALGAINGAFNLDVALTALEHKGNGKIVSQPSVITQNNVLAVMSNGFQIPFQTTQNNTTTITFKDAALKLTVTPHITGAGTIVMDIALENGAPDFSRAVNGNPSINTQRAETKVQVPDGVTTVIGGIQSSNEFVSNDGTPGLSRVPLFNWLFKSKSTQSKWDELVIFITPRIVR